MIVLPAAAAFAAVQEPELRRSERLDVRRLGKVSEDERSVLRIEWRAGLSGAEEARRVDEMLVQLRRMEGTIAAIGLMVRNMPTQRPMAPMVDAAAAPAEPNGYDLRLLAANIAAASLVALWWFRRRKTAKTKAMNAGTAAGVEAPVPAPIAVARRQEPHVPAVPVAVPVAADLPREASPLPPQPALSAPVAASVAAAPILMPEPAPAASSAEPAPATPEPMSPPVAPPAADSVIIDFSLEEVGPEDIVVKADSRPKPPPTPSPPAASSAPATTPVEPTLQLAEIMLSMGLEQGAAQALVEYTEANPRAALHHWLKLLGIYRKRGLHKEFMAAAENLRKNFNIQAQYLQKSHTGEMPTLENFSRVAEHVQTIWPRQDECIDYLGRLLEDNRDGERAGFPQAVAEEILLLIDILKETSGVNQAAAT